MQSSLIDSNHLPSLAAKAPIRPTDADLNKVLVEWNATATDYPRHQCIHELFEACATESPDSTAVVWGGEQLTYGGLNAHANQLAHRLRSLGLRPETLVGVYVNRSADFLISVLGILKAGGAYLPLDTDYPVNRLQFMLQDSAAQVVITSEALPNDFNSWKGTVVDLSKDGVLIEAYPRSNVPNVNTAEHLAYAIYTSGSTGQPKGTAIPHRAVVRLVRGQNYAPFSSKQRFLLLSSTSFDAATFEIWGSLLNGAACVVFPKKLLEFQELETVIRKQSVTCLWLTAGLFNEIIDAYPSVLETVQHVMTGGEALSVSHVSKALKLFPKLHLTNGYGPTESTTFACCHPIEPTETFPNGSVPIGRPIANTRCYLLDEQRRPVLIGESGELYLGGDGLARGYVNRPELTAEKFVPDPFSPEAGSRLYRTGDLARYLPDGNIEFLGRADQQVKIRGFRIELGEIESVLAAHPDVLKVVVMVRQDNPSHKSLAAYLVTGPEAKPGTAELKEYLLKKLPDYMVPTAFVFLPSLPLTPNGKIDRRALPAPEKAASGLPPGPTGIGNTTEQGIANIWRNVLRVSEVGLDQNFFDVGGDSIRLASVHARLQEMMGTKFAITDLFLHPTIRSLAAHLGSTPKAESPVSAYQARAQRQRQAFAAPRQAVREKPPGS